jgi:predicted ferric reductase
METLKTKIDIDRIVWHAQRPTARRRNATAPTPRVADILALLGGIGLGISVGFAFWGESLSSLNSPGGWVTLSGRITGLAGSYLMLVMLLLISRLPWLERVVGQDRLVAWHRRIGGWPIVLIAMHIGLITWGYAQMTSVGILRQFWTFIVHYPDILASVVAFGLLMMAGFTSARIARQRMKYETWWMVHLYIYLALSLAFAHQIRTGVMFIGHPLIRDIWILMWIAGASAILGFRLILPVVRNLRHQLRVAAVQEETPGVYSIIVSGRNLSSLSVSGGQFFMWRFMSKGLWAHSHPYSLSALPRPPFLRVTIKGLGDQSSAVAQLKPGTRVFIEGPYGKFTRHARSAGRVVLIGAGVGITPLRALLEDLPTSVDVTVVVRASSLEDIVHREELSELVSQRNGRMFELVGSRHEVRMDASELKKYLGHVNNADIYVCGPTAFNESVTKAVLRLGARDERIHQEIFSF